MKPIPLIFLSLFLFACTSNIKKIQFKDYTIDPSMIYLETTMSSDPDPMFPRIKGYIIIELNDDLVKIEMTDKSFSDSHKSIFLIKPEKFEMTSNGLLIHGDITSKEINGDKFSQGTVLLNNKFFDHKENKIVEINSFHVKSKSEFYGFLSIYAGSKSCMVNDNLSKKIWKSLQK